MAMPDLHRYPLNFYLINNVEDIVIFYFFILRIQFGYVHRNAQGTVVEKLEN